MRRVAWLALALAGCDPSVSSDSGDEALLRVAGGSFRRGAFPKGEGGPSVLAAYLGRTELRLGEQEKSFSGVLESVATALAVELEGDSGFWIVPAGFPLPESPNQPSFSAPLSFSTHVPPGPGALLLAAADGREVYGETLRVPVSFVRGPTPSGALVVSLRWDTASDLDLHVVTPSGVEIHSQNPSSATPTQPDDPGVLDFDSNADCAIDRRNLEAVTWQSSPPSGRYLVRVDTPSLCGESIARWAVEVRLRGERWASAEGTSTEAATRAEHGRGAGVQALTFDVP